MPERWRLSRAALYGLLTGFLVALIGHRPTPPGFIPWAYQLGTWTGLPIVCAIIFTLVALVHNFRARRNLN
jgi:Na+/proline symporter